MKLNIGNRIKEQRRLNGLTQSELADKLHIDYRTVSSWESNRTEPKQAQIQQMCSIFGCSDYDLTGIASAMDTLIPPEFNAVVELYKSLNAEQQNKALLYMIELKMGK